MEASGTQKRLTVREEMDYLQKTIGELNKEVELLAERLSWIMEMSVESKKVKFKKESFRAKLLELLLKDDKSRKKEWSWDEVIEEIEDTKDKEATTENKKKFYPACDGLSKFIAQKIGVNDLLIFNKSTVQINPKYL